MDQVIDSWSPLERLEFLASVFDFAPAQAFAGRYETGTWEHAFSVSATQISKQIKLSLKFSKFIKMD